MKEIIQEILSDFQDRLQVIESNTKDKLAEASQGIILCHETLIEMRRTVHKHGFEGPESEILFFKSIKVVPQCYLFYYESVLSCESFMPPISVKKQRKHLENEMDNITKLFRANSIFINYLRLRRTDLDDRYFTRKHLNDGALVPTNGTQYDADFNTMRDVLLAKVRASYRYMEFINRRLGELRLTDVAIKVDDPLPLAFTGNKIDLVELVYALHAAKVFKGDPDISIIQKAIERLFDVELGYIYTRFQQIQDRSGEQQKFLPKLVSALAALLDKRDGLELG